ncbi:hypothetical protein FDI11_gp42 [Mycobacterium phage Tiger]|uniref:Uncharacterized protein n=3 Tax=Benedictvirus TaxID=2946819 RepID=H9NCW4_9CAUD|nr:hypothetical protein X823_gp42 [Mycobacterium phage Conspiracy]YP_008859076.1 hypothetical protein X816_gp40 [Mycobacterium phage Jovo]YP_009607693.1 hypothetical protein FDI11_gp42 [Mycobacterium phage Tiger]YP_010061013.1 hypothetical protein KIP52_gp32 [Mycobacterium phage Archetta]ATW60023.1 hypothetical protein SEA_PHLORENCE_49 [Mycobacterium phage Phlorence]ATW60443.1 hypothetical protein SEA_FORGETIT_51 [Mycobacterium phage ForGetIt]ATW60996.1 hypothetical protein SEA_ARAGOG_50 [Myc
MSYTRKLGTIVTETPVTIEDVNSRLELKVGEKIIAIAEKDTWRDDGNWTVSPTTITYANGFVVISESEAEDALEDLGLLYMSLKKVDK